MTSLLKRKQARVDALAESAGTSLAADALRRMLRSPVALLGAFIVLVFLALPIALLVVPRSRRFGIYFAIGMVLTALVVLGVASLVLYFMVRHDG